MKKLRSSLIFLALAACSSSSDVVNIFPQKLDPADKATKYLEEGSPEKAISLMLDELGSDFASVYNGLDASTVTTAPDALAVYITDNTKATYASILASAEAQKAGIDPIELILKSATLATAATSSTASSTSAAGSQSNNVLMALWPILPTASTENILAAKKASAALMSVSAYYIDEDKLKLTVFQLATTSLSLKALDTNGNNQLDLSEITSIDAGSAAAILGQILTATLAAASMDSSSGTNAQGVGNQISEVAAAIQASAGANDQEKLQNWLGSMTGQ